MILDQHQLMIRDMARSFAREQLAPFAADWDREARFPSEAVAAMGELGLLGMLVPQEWGGAGVDFVSYAAAVEEIAAGDGSCSTIMAVHNSVGCLPILKFGSENQKGRFLRALATGLPVWFLANRFAAKEALSKALGTGLRYPVTLHAISVTSDGVGKPSFGFHGPLPDYLAMRGVVRHHLGLSHEKGMACAVVVLEQ